MSKSINKLSAIGLSVTTAVWLSGAGMLMPLAAQAVTVEELQAQITALLEQINALNAQLAALQGAAAPTTTFTRNLTVGDTGADVKALQEFLNANGVQVAASGAGSPGNETEYFGPLTKAAVAEYQDLHAAQILTPLGLTAGTGYFGTSTRSYINSLAAGVPPVTPPVTPPVGTGLTLAVASDNPASATVPKGATGVEFLKFTVSGKGTLTGLTFKRSGIGLTADFGSSGFYLYEGGSRLTSGRSINSTTHEVTFVNLALAIDGTRTLSLVADISSSATAGSLNAFSLTSATGDPTPTGSLSGNAMTIGSTTVGTITADDSSAPANPRIGQTEALMLNLQLTAGSTEDIEVKRISLTEGGTITNSYLTNFTLKQAGNTLATASAVGSKDLITFELATPFTLEKGQNRTFEIYGDIAGSARSNDTIALYIDSASDVSATGKTYGYAVTPTISDIDTTSETDTLTIQGGQVTITHNGPLAGEISLRGQDVEVFNFTLASQNNIEIRNLRFTASTSGLISGEGFNDFKIWDTSTNSVVTSAVDITTTTSTSVVFTDVINLSAGESKTYKATADVDADNDADDTLRIDLAAFQSSDIKNMDNNQYVSTNDIVPSTTITGNIQTVKAPTLDIQLSGTPASQTIVRGTQDVPLVGISLRATADKVKVSTLRVTATASVNTLTSGEIQSLRLYDGTTQVGDAKSLDTTNLNATFTNLDFWITKGQTKVLTVTGNIATDATDTDVYRAYLASITTDDITAYDSEGNAVTLSGTAANLVSTVTVTITTTGSVLIAKAPDDTDSEAGIILADTESVLAKFKWTAANEAMTIKKMRLLVVPTNSATATSAAVADDVTVVKLYESNGTTAIGDAAGYTITGSGANSGVVTIENLSWTVPKNGNATMVVKGTLNTIANGSDSGQDIYVSVMGTSGTTFEAQGASAVTNTLTAATGNQKVVYKTKPTISLSSSQPSTLSAGEVAVLKFKVAADSKETASWGKVQLYVQMTGATMSAVDAIPGTTGNVKIKKVSTGSNLNIGTAYSGSAVTSTGQATITGGNSGYVSLILAADEDIAANTEQEYEVSLTFANLTSGSGNSYALTKLNKEESTIVNASAYDTVETATEDGQPSFIWSDNSAVSHSHTSLDWANGVFVKTIPSSVNTVSN